MNASINELTEKVIGAAIEVHKTLGPGLTENSYRRALAHEMTLRSIPFEEGKVFPAVYKDIVLEEAFTADFIIGDLLPVDIRAVDALSAMHESGMQTLLRLSGHKIGLLINFNAALLTRGLRRIVLREKEK